ncbi:hypothetical protein T439DRAFT_45747 [Meredithblackwellia eburnea MCA 4105]
MGRSEEPIAPGPFGSRRFQRPSRRRENPPRARSSPAQDEAYILSYGPHVLGSNMSALSVVEALRGNPQNLRSAREYVEALSRRLERQRLNISFDRDGEVVRLRHALGRLVREGGQR